MDARRFEEILSTGGFCWLNEVKDFSSEQVSEVLKSDKVSQLMRMVVKVHVLTPEQQMVMLEKKSYSLLKAYLYPNGVFDKNRRFAAKQEKVFLSWLDELSTFYPEGVPMEVDYSAA